MPEGAPGDKIQPRVTLTKQHALGLDLSSWEEGCHLSLIFPEETSSINLQNGTVCVNRPWKGAQLICGQIKNDHLD